jgi:hypothetical protein
VDFCTANFGGPGDCAAVPCFDCGSGLPCVDPTCGDGVVNQQTDQCGGSNAAGPNPVAPEAMSTVTGITASQTTI